MRTPLRAHLFAAAAVSFCMLFVVPDARIVRAAETRDIVFPVFGPASYSDDFGDPRSGGRTHEGNDIFAEKGKALLSAVDGEVRWVTFPEASYGWGVEIEDADGWRYRYLHINNDTPGTDNGFGGGRNAYAPGIESGAPVKAGQLIGYLGDSGNAEATSSHLHFEIRKANGNPINPYESLLGATHVPAPVPRDPLPGEFFPYATFMGGANVAVGEIDPTQDGEEIVTGAGPGGGPHVRVFNANGDYLFQFYAYATSFRGGVDVAVADLTGDGIGEIITGAGPGGGPNVKAFDAQGNRVSNFLAYGASSRHGVRVAGADLDGDSIAEIIVGPAVNESPNMRVFTPNGTMLRQFLAYAETFRGGIDVAAHAATEWSPAVIVTGAGIGGGPNVKVFDANGARVSNFFSHDPAFRGGVRVSIADQFSANDGPEIFAAPASRGGPDYKIHALNGTRLFSRTAFEEWWTGGYDIAAGTDEAYAVIADVGRQVSVQEVSRR